VFFRCGRPHFLVQITSDFSKYMVCLHGQGGLSQCGHFVDKRKGVNFLRFCADVFYGRPLNSDANNLYRSVSPTIYKQNFSKKIMKLANGYWNWPLLIFSRAFGLVTSFLQNWIALEFCGFDGFLENDSTNLRRIFWKVRKYLFL